MIGGLVLATVTVAHTLCVASKGEVVGPLSRCISTTNSIIAAAPPGGPFTWIRGDAAEVATGIAPEEPFDAHTAAPFGITLQLAGSDPDAWPAPVTIDVVSDSGNWTTQLGAATAAALRIFDVPRSVHTLRIRAPHHAEKVIQVPATGKIAPVVLQHLPLISGTVIDRDNHQPIGGATVRAGRLIATTDAAGLFRLEISGDWPSFVVAAAEGKGVVPVAVPHREAGVMLPPIVLSRAGTLHVAWVYVAPLTIEIHREAGGSDQVIAMRKVTAEVSEAEFLDLGAGDYRVLLRGAEPLEQYGAKVHIESGQDTPLDIMNFPIPLELLVEKAGSPIGPATIDIMHTTGKWSGHVAIDTSGKAMTTLWQPGSFGVAVGVGPNAYFTTRRAENESARWTIDMPRRRITGTVERAGSASAVPNAIVSLSVHANGGTTALRTTTDDGGKFSFDSIVEGEHSIVASADGYQSARTSYIVAEEDADRDLTIQLEPAAPVTLEVVDSRGVPVSGAAVLEPTANVDVETGVDGHVVLSLVPRQRTLIYVVPREGSFAIAHVQPSSTDPIVSRIVVPPGSATITLIAEPATQLPTVNLVARYNGDPIPPPVIDAFYRMQRTFFRISNGAGTLRSLPVGFYEFWPIFSLQDAPSTLAGLGPPPAVRVAVQPGENRVEMTFERK